ncbi:MAG: hypothetical protein J3R72DRAFT_423719 [Linnemannia gamsii]|nr:MAG: hypothetical protein J3R72DRAFT_423719 [Linnemannia gamsii]
MVFGNALYVRSGDIALPFLRGPDFKNLDPPRLAAIPGVTLDVVVTGPAAVVSPLLYGFQQIAEQAAHFPKYNSLLMLPSHRTPTSHFTTGNNMSRTFNYYTSAPLTLGRQSNDTATRTHKRALEQNKVKAIIRKIAVCTDLDALHAKGDGCPQDFRTALECYLRTAQKGQAQALISVGDLFLDGQAVQQSPIIALDWYLKAAYLGDNNARYKIDQLRLELPRLFSHSQALLLEGLKGEQQDRHQVKDTEGNFKLGVTTITAEEPASSPDQYDFSVLPQEDLLASTSITPEFANMMETFGDIYPSSYRLVFDGG